MYTHTNFKTKKALKEAVARGDEVKVFQPNAVFPVKRDGIVTLEGPHYPEPHRWYARVEIENRRVIKVLK